VESALAGHGLGEAAQSGSSCARAFCALRLVAPHEARHLDGGYSRSRGLAINPFAR
jgi:hypothetical protein